MLVISCPTASSTLTSCAAGGGSRPMAGRRPECGEVCGVTVGTGGARAKGV